MLMDSSKCGKSLPYTFGALRDINVLVSDDDLPADLKAAAIENGVTVI
jgi:DeoR/GlpR family transcriptional regulator of sugar metabolism